MMGPFYGGFGGVGIFGLAGLVLGIIALVKISSLSKEIQILRGTIKELKEVGKGSSETR